MLILWKLKQLNALTKSSSCRNHFRELMAGENQCEDYGEWTSEHSN